MDNECFFNIEVGNGKYQKFGWMNITDTNVYENYVEDLSGYMIPVPKDYVLTGAIRFEMKNPRYATANGAPNCALIKDIRIEYATPDKSKVVSIVNDSNTDTLYTGMINNNNVSEFPEINLKVATNTEKGLSFAAVL
ncbi:MAG: hypothetical protein RR397_09295 [Odoribacter sp.]